MISRHRLGSRAHPALRHRNCRDEQKTKVKNRFRFPERLHPANRSAELAEIYIVSNSSMALLQRVAAVSSNEVFRAS